MKLFIKIFVFLIIVGTLVINISLYKFYMKPVPAEFGVYKILYRSENSFGFGPGGNEAGLRVYELPSKAAEKIKKEGLDYLLSLTQTSKNQHKRAKWRRTPMITTKYWTDYMSLPEGTDYSLHKPSITSYLYRYGMGVKIDTEIAELINDALVIEGNYIGGARNGILIIIPDKKRIVFAYSG